MAKMLQKIDLWLALRSMRKAIESGREVELAAERLLRKLERQT